MTDFETKTKKFQNSVQKISYSYCVLSKTATTIMHLYFQRWPTEAVYCCERHKFAYNDHTHTHTHTMSSKKIQDRAIQRFHNVVSLMGIFLCAIFSSADFSTVCTIHSIYYRVEGTKYVHSLTHTSIRTNCIHCEMTFHCCCFFFFHSFAQSYSITPIRLERIRGVVVSVLVLHAKGSPFNLG